MDEETSGIDIDEDAYLDEGETSDIDDDDDFLDESEQSVFQNALPGDWSALLQYGKSLDKGRGRGRPKKESGFSRKRPESVLGLKLKRWKTQSSRSSVKRSDSVDTASVPQSPVSESCTLDPETGALIPIQDKIMLAPEEPPYFPEQYPGKVCAFCNLGERSQLGQGELIRLVCPEGFKPQRSITCMTSDPLELDFPGDKSPRTQTLAVTCRRQKSLNKCRNPSLTNIEHVDELSIIGYPEEPDVSIIFESQDFYVHNSCAIWSAGVTRNEDSVLQNVGPVIVQSSSRKCSHCNHYGASIPCRVGNCNRYFHFPCAAGSGSFQDIKRYSLFCNLHLGQVPLLASEDIMCMSCYALGDVANLVMCSACGRHHHGSCAGLAQQPGVRAGWNCRDCRSCQVCRVPEEDTKIMACELCDKVYHPQCLRPIVTTIPKYGWKCKCCRVCTDCGSRTPGAGLSSRWHNHFTVCDSCYQQRNKGFSCPLCRRAYRAVAYREMVQCSACHKFVHGTCDPDADLSAYQKRKEINPEYEYVCTVCKASRVASLKRKNSFDDSESNLSASQESLNLCDDIYDPDTDSMMQERAGSEDSTYRFLGLGKGKPFLANKIAKRMGFPVSRQKGTGKFLPGKISNKRKSIGDVNRKRGKIKIRGFFSSGVCLEKPSADASKSDEEPGVENRLVLCSAKDRFVLTQDICVMCGALGTDQEGCLIACIQCGQCYHPYCVNVKVTKVILEKGWRCLDCTVCEGCGQRNDEGRLILCDDCDISYHIYCMDPPLDYVPDGNWKCKWCALCQSCGASDPGFNCNWMSNFTECGPCHSLHACPNCSEPYSENELIIKCTQCERWLHCKCDSIKSEADAERCADEGYSCVLCRPRDEPPPHLLPPPAPVKPPSPVKSPLEEKPHRAQNFYVDGVCLSENGMQLIKSLGPEQQAAQRKKRRKGIVMDKEAGIRATIESVVAGGSLENSLEDAAKLELVDVKEEPTEIYKEGMLWTPKTNGAPPEGFTVYTTENGIMVLRKKRQRNLQKLGIGGFIVRNRTSRVGDNDEIDTLPGQAELGLGDEKRRKPVRRKIKTKLCETFPSYIQDAFFGRELLDTSKDKELESSEDSEEDLKLSNVSEDKLIKLNQDEIRAFDAFKTKQEPDCTVAAADSNKQDMDTSLLATSPIKEEDDTSDTEALKDVLELPNDLLDTDLVKSIMNDDDLKTEDLPDTNLPEDTDHPQDPSVSSTHKDELSYILNSHLNFNLPNMDSKDVEEMLKGVLTDSQESQETQEPIGFPLGAPPPAFQQQIVPPPIPQPQILQQPIVRPTSIQLPSVQNPMNSPMSFAPPPSPYHSEYSNSPQFSPAFSEPPSPWIGAGPSDLTPETVNEVNSVATPTVTSSYNQRSTEKMKADEALGNGATISAVLYANMNHPEWQSEYPIWADRYKQILKKWRALSADKKAPYLQQARDNRSAFRMKKAQQDQDKLSQQQKSVREAEQERQWKQLQASRQQQAQQQQQVIHDQRLQAIARVRDMTGQPPQNQPFTTDQVLQINTQDGNTSPSQRSPFPTQGIQSPARNVVPHSPNFVNQPMPPPNRADVMRPSPLNIRVGTPAPIQSPTQFSPSQNELTPTNESPGDPYLQSPQTPQRPFIMSPPGRTPTAVYQQITTTQKPQFQQPPPSPSPRPGTITFVPQGAKPEDNRQLRDLLQRQQSFKKLDEQLIPGTGQQRIWPPQDNPETQFVEGQIQQQSPTAGDATFRQPLPPALIRTRAPVAVTPGKVARQFIAPIAGLRPGQALDPRMKLLLQQQQQRIGQITGVQQPQILTQNIVRPNLIRNQDFTDQLVAQRQQQIQAADQIVQRQLGQLRSPLQQQKNIILEHRVIVTQPQPVTPSEPSQPNFVSTPTTSSEPVPEPETTATDTQEIPDSVTAELEQLEQEGGGMVEVEGVGDLLGLGDDDDELLAEMGADFNILEYADPELDALTGGEKTNILDSLDLEEPESDKEDSKLPKKSEGGIEVPKPSTEVPQPKETVQTMQVPQPPVVPQQVAPPQPQINQMPQQPLPDLLVQQQVQQRPIATQPQIHQQIIQTRVPSQQQQLQIQQQMQHQVQNAAAMGRPMVPGTRLMSPDGAVGIVTANNTVQVSYPNLQFQQDGTITGVRFAGKLTQQRIQMRMATPRMPAQLIQHAAGPRLGVPPPPPPPYPGPPPPYPGSTTQQLSQQPQLQQQQQQMCRGAMMVPHAAANVGPSDINGYANHQQFQRRPLLLQEQPLLLEELLEQEKREQEKQLQNVPETVQQTSTPTGQLLSDQDFERLLRTDVPGSTRQIGQSPITSPTHGIPTQGVIQNQNMGNVPPLRPQFQQRTITQQNLNNQWQTQQPQPQLVPTPAATPRPQATAADTTTSVPPFNIPLLPAPPLPPEHIVTEQDRQTQLHYEQWLNHQNQIVTQQLKYYETEVQKLRKIKKSLNSKQRQLRKSNNELSEADAFELQRVSSEQAVLQKQLEASRKQSRQHGMLIQEYRNKQQAKQQLQQQQQQQSPQQRPQTPGQPQLTQVVTQQIISRASPVHHTPTSQSPLMSPTQSPMMAPHGSPMHSPGPMIINSPGPGSVASILQSPQGNSMSPHNIQPRIGTPHSQTTSEDGPFSPGPSQSPLPVVHRMNVPGGRLVTSPGTYTADIRPGTPQFVQLQQNRFVRPVSQLDQQNNRPRLQLQNVGFQQALRNAGGRSPLASPQPIMSNVVSPQHNLTNSPQQVLQRQVIVQQQVMTNENGETIIGPSQRSVQLVQQRQLTQLQQQQLIRQQLLQQQQQQQNSGQHITAQQLHHQQMLQQQHQLAKQQQQQIAQQLGQQRARSPQLLSLQQQQQMQQIQQQINQQKLLQQQQQQQQQPIPPSSPMGPNSPMVQQIMGSPSHAPPRSPMISGGIVYNQPPNSPMPRSPAVHQIPPSSPMLQQQLQQTPSSPMPRSPMIGGSPMQIMRPPSNSNTLCSPERPLSVENPNTPRTYTPQLTQDRPESRGGGNPHNPLNPMPGPGSFHRFKLGLRGGSPMWSYGKGAKRAPQITSKEEKPSTSDQKVKKESHYKNVSILKKKSPRKFPDASQALGSKVGSLVCSEYNDLDDSSSTPPISPPPLAPVEKKPQLKLKMPGKKAPEDLLESGECMVMDSSPEEKHLQCNMDSDDDIDKALVTSEVSLNSVAQSDLDDISMVESFSQGDLANVISSPLETGVAEEYVLFSSDMVGDLSVDCEDSLKQIMEGNINIAEEFAGEIEILNKNGNSLSPDDNEILLTQTDKIDIGNEIVTNTISSKADEDTAEDDLLHSLRGKEMLTSEATSPEERIATTEDFEELIDGEKDQRPDTRHILEIHKYASKYPAKPINVIVKKPVTPPATTVITEPVETASHESPESTLLKSTLESSSIMTTIMSLSSQDTALPSKIFQDESGSPEESGADENEPDSPIKEDIRIIKPSLPMSVISTTTSNVLQQYIQSNKAKVITTKSDSKKIENPGPLLSVNVKTFPESIIDDNSEFEPKSVEISIPSPTPSQEKMLDNLARQALEVPGREDKQLSNDFQTIEDMLDMIENITSDPKSMSDKEKSETHSQDSISDINDIITNDLNDIDDIRASPMVPTPPLVSVSENTTPISVATETIKPTVMPQLSPLRQPAELTSNMANVSQQLRTFLSSFETGEKSIIEAVTSTGPPPLISASSPITTPRIMQQPIKLQTILHTSVAGSVIQNSKQKRPSPGISPQRSSPKPPLLVPTSSKMQIPQTTSAITALLQTNHSIASLSQAISTHNSNKPQVPIFTTSKVITTGVLTSIASTSASSRVTVPSLNAMLQSHPAATIPQTVLTADTITTASILASHQNVSPNVRPGLVSARPKVDEIPKLAKTLPVTNLLHTHLTKMPLKRPSVTEESEVETKVEIKQENEEEVSSSGNKYRMDDSQNVLLKQLLQNTGCATTSAPTATTVATSTVMSLEQQLARPVPPSHTPLLPPLIQQSDPKPRYTQVMSRETSFLSRPVVSSPQSSQPVQTTSISQPATPTQQLFVEVKRGVPVRSLSMTREELLSPPTKFTSSNESSLQTPPITYKQRDVAVPECSPLSINAEVKKEIFDESSQHSSVSDQGNRMESNQTDGNELTTPTDPTEKSIKDALELKRLKRRQYQQKRRKIQIQAKEANNTQPKKRPRKLSKLDEDYDVFNDNLMAQLRQLPPMVVMEPILSKNYSVSAVFGSGDLSKIGTKAYNTRQGDLTGDYGLATITHISDYYETKPFGFKDPLPEKPPVSTQRGFYDQEFEPIKFRNDDRNRIDLFFRDRDDELPDTMISCSSPECTLAFESSKNISGFEFNKYSGLKYIKEDDDEDEEEELERLRRRMSPEIPIIAPIPIRLKPGGQYFNEYDVDVDKENREVVKVKKEVPVVPPPTPMKDSNNVTVTLTLTSSAAEDIMGVLRDLANILHIPAPTTYQIVERTTTPPSQKLGLYRTKGKDGKEGAPIDIQSILNGAAKFCRHCDVVILNTMIRKKVSDLPFLAKDSELLLEGDELFFCSSSCYMQFALMHRAPNMPQEKVAAIVDHLSQNGKENRAKLTDSKDNLKMDVDEILASIHAQQSNMTVAQQSLMLKNEMELKNELNELSIQIPEGGMERKRKLEITPNSQQGPPTKSWKGMRYKTFREGTMHPDKKHKRLSEKEMTEYLFRIGITVMPTKIPEDTRACMFCHMMGDATADGPARLLNFDVDKWVHLNCALWSDDVYETVNGALMNLENALHQSLTQQCVHCQEMGATIRCFKVRCSNVYHLGCAVKDSCVFYKNKTVYCTIHALKNEKENELTTLSVYRRVYVNRDENRQVAAVMHHSDQGNLLRVGSLIFLNVGQILPHQLQSFHTPNFIYPIGYKIVRFYWSMRKLNKRCRYVCSIHDVCGRPEFRILVQEPNEDDLELRDATPRAVWGRILEQLANLRKDNNCVKVFPKFITGEDLFGLTEPAIVRVLESLPGIETLTDYRFKYGRNPLLELPLAINPSGSARTEARLKNALPWKRPHTQRTAGASRPTFTPTSAPGSSEAACPYSKQFVHSKSSQYKKMKQEWRNNVYLARSKIQGLGLYATRDLEKHTMVIEYIGELIRSELAELREKQYEAKNRGIYMFRLDEERVVDATLKGGLARYINHSCNPNCVAEMVEVDRDLRIIIFAKRRISRGEELAYDYKFDIEDDQHKISCMCGAPNCKKWMN